MIIPVRSQSVVNHLILWQEPGASFALCDSDWFSPDHEFNGVMDFGNTLWKSAAQPLCFYDSTESCQAYKCFCCSHNNQSTINILKSLFAFFFRSYEKYSYTPRSFFRTEFCKWDDMNVGDIHMNPGRENNKQQQTTPQPGFISTFLPFIFLNPNRKRNTRIAVAPYCP